MDLKKHDPEFVRIVAAFAALYVIWGSTYLAIHLAVATIPVCLMAGVRFLIAGALLYPWTLYKGAKKPDIGHWKTTTIIGTLLLVIGNLGVLIASKTIPSGLVSLMVAMVPIYICLLDWLRPTGTIPRMRTILGLILGMIGMGILIGPSGMNNGAAINIEGVLWLTLSSISWSAGSLYSRSARLPESPLMSTAMQMLTGGAILMIISIALGEPRHLNIATIKPESVIAVLYLITFGSIVGFSAYVFLLQKVEPARVSTYAYVNPVIAVFLGWMFAGEVVSTQTMIAAAVIVFAVWTITTAGKGRSKRLSKQTA